MTLKRRINKLEGMYGGTAPDGPKIIFICDAETDEPGYALIVGGTTIVRHEGESTAEFKARASGPILNAH